MTMYACARCGHQSTTKGNLQKHLRRKTLCEALLEDLTVEQIYQRHPELAPVQKHKPFACSQCTARFTSSDARSRHMRHVCRGSNDTAGPAPSELETIRAELERLKMIVDGGSTASSSVNIASNNNNNNTIHQNVVINAFGSEDVSHITPALLEQCIRRTNKGMIDLLNHMHFEDKSRGNANIRITNQKNGLAQTHNGQRWLFCLRDQAIKDMLNCGQEMMQEQWDEGGTRETLHKTLSQSLYNHISAWMDKLADEDRETIQSMIQDIFILILNNSEAEDTPAAA